MSHSFLGKERPLLVKEIAVILKKRKEKEPAMDYVTTQASAQLP